MTESAPVVVVLAVAPMPALLVLQKALVPQVPVVLPKPEIPLPSESHQ